MVSKFRTWFSDWLVNLGYDRVVTHCLKEFQAVEMEEETATAAEDLHRTDVFISLWEHQWMLWDPSDPQLQELDARLWQISKDLDADSLLFNI